jgi:hypothetical protein
MTSSGRHDADPSTTPYALRRGRRELSSVTSMRPRCYEVVVDEAADQAARLIASEA